MRFKIVTIIWWPCFIHGFQVLHNFVLRWTLTSTKAIQSLVVIRGYLPSHNQVNQSCWCWGVKLALKRTRMSATGDLTLDLTVTNDKSSGELSKTGILLLKWKFIKTGINKLACLLGFQILLEVNLILTFTMTTIHMLVLIMGNLPSQNYEIHHSNRCWVSLFRNVIIFWPMVTSNNIWPFANI